MSDPSTPVVRFKGHSDEWKSRTLSELVQIGSGRDYKHLAPGEIPVYGTGGYMTSVDEALSLNDDALGIGRKGTIDKPFLLKAPFWTVDTLFYAVPLASAVLGFLHPLALTVDWKRYDESTGVPSLSKETIYAIDVRVPATREQQDIGAFFSHLETTIDTGAKRLEKLRALRKTMLVKMFPQGDSREPEIRFDGFTGDWRQRSLGDVITYEQPTPYLVDSTEYSDRYATPVLTAGQTFILGYTNEKTGIYPASVSAPVVIFDDFTTAVKWVDFPFKAKSSAMKILTVSDPTVVELRHAFLWMQRAHRVPQEHARQWIGNYSQLRLPVPSLEEQRAVGDYFRELDGLIEVESQKLEKLRHLKSSFLRLMFA